MSKIDIIKENQFKKYAYYDIDQNILEDLFSKLSNLDDENEIMLNFNKEVENYIIEEIKKDNIDMQIKVIDYHSRLKKMILINPKYNLEKEIIDKTYEDAIELLKTKYDNSKTIYTNILNNMRYILFNKGTVDSTILEQGIYDVSFLKEYVKAYNIDLSIFADILDCSIEELDDYFSSKKLVTKRNLELILDCFNVDSYDKLKEKVNNSINKIRIEKKESKEDNKTINKPIKNNHQNKEKLQNKSINKSKQTTNKEKIVNKPINKNVQPKNKEKSIKDIKKYDLSFIKEYAKLYNLNSQQLSNKFHCGVGRVNDILEGKLLISESIIDEIAYEFGAQNYNDLKDKITKKIEIKKANMIKKEYKVVEEKQEIKETNEISINKINKDKLFSMLDVKNLSHRKYLVTVLLFSGVVDKSIDEIAEFLQMSKEYIKKVYIEDLLIIENELKKENIKLIYTKKDPINK